jgi:uncharacterized membrane protein
MSVREGSAYVLSQFVGGMAAPLFLFMAGMTFGFQMESLDRREPSPFRRWVAALRRGGYILAIAYLFRLSNTIASMPRPDWSELTKVDILNCMGLAMIAFAVVAWCDATTRVRAALIGAVAIASASPLVAHLPWGNTPAIIREYLAAGAGRGRFAFFPCAAYIGFGLAAGALVRRAATDRLDRLMQWLVLTGFALILSGQYFSNIPYSLYPQSDFWIDSPALIFIRVGLSLLALSGAYVWTEHASGRGWSWMQTIGRHSLLVYWVHVMLVYGDIFKPLKRALTIPQTTIATVIVVLLMLAICPVPELIASRISRQRTQRIAA